MKEFKSKPIKGIDSLDEYSLFNVLQSEKGKLGAEALHSKYSKEKTLEWANMGGTYGHIQGKKNVESGHWAKCHELAKEACYVPILQCDKKTGEIIKEWKSAKIAAKELGLSNTAISNNLTGGTKSSGGFIWKYKENNLDNSK